MIRSDVVRKELAQAVSRQDLDAPEWTEKTYVECRNRAAALLFAGKVRGDRCDVSSRIPSQAFLELARRWGVPAIILLCQTEPEIICRRLEQRRGDASDADWQVYLRLAGSWKGPRPGAEKQFEASTPMQAPSGS